MEDVKGEVNNQDSKVINSTENQERQEKNNQDSTKDLISGVVSALIPEINKIVEIKLNGALENLKKADKVEDTPKELPKW